MEGKGLLEVMLTRLWLLIHTGSPLLGRSPASAWGLRQAQSLGQKARSRLVSCELQPWCQNWMLWSDAWRGSVLCVCGGAKFAVPGIPLAPLGRREVCFLMLWLSSGMVCSLGAEGRRAVDFWLWRVTPRLGSPVSWQQEAPCKVAFVWLQPLDAATPGSHLWVCVWHQKAQRLPGRRSLPQDQPVPLTRQSPRCPGCATSASSLRASPEVRLEELGGIEWKDLMKRARVGGVANSFLLKLVKQ